MLDFFQKGGNAKWIITICVIAVVIYVIYRRITIRKTTLNS